MAVHISIALDDEQQSRFETIASARHEPLETVVAEALVEYLDYDTAFRNAVKQGLADARAGDVYDFDQVMDETRERIAAVPDARDR